VRAGDPLTPAQAHRISDGADAQEQSHDAPYSRGIAPAPAGYSGSTVPIVNALTGEITAAQIFADTLGASNYTFACATPRQTTTDWIGAQVRALEFIGGVPQESRARDSCGNQQDRIM
jgi:hypothetical protein